MGYPSKICVLDFLKDDVIIISSFIEGFAGNELWKRFGELGMLRLILIYIVFYYYLSCNGMLNKFLLFEITVLLTKYKSKGFGELGMRLM